MLDSFWLWPFLSGLGAAVLLGLAGASLFIRSASLQGLVIAQGAAAGGILATALTLPILPVAFLLAGASYWWVQYAVRLKPERILLIFLLGGALINALLANTTHLHTSADRWLAGDIYYVGRGDAFWLLTLSGLTLVLIPVLRNVWQKSQLAPDCFGPPLTVLQRLPEALWLLCVVVLSSYLLGLPASLFLLLFPAWLSAYWSRGLSPFLWWSIFLSVLLFLLAWFTALWFDQPFAPVLILGGCVCFLLVYAAYRLTTLVRACFR